MKIQDIGMNTTVKLAGVSLAAMMAITSMPAMAQIDEIIVTARRREESLQTVPIAVTAFSQDQLTEKAVTSAYDVARVVPGLAVYNTGNPSLPIFAVRGKGQNYGAAAGSVEAYFAEVPLSSPFQMPGLPAQFFDLESLQVLKGPQGTLFGRSTTGGAVLIVPHAPELGEFSGYGRVQGGPHGHFQFEGAANVPIGDKLAIRGAVFDYQRKGYMHASATQPVGAPGEFGFTYPGYAPNTPILNSFTGQPLGAQTFNNTNTVEGRVSVLFEPTDKLSNTTIFTYHYDKVRTSRGSGLTLSAFGDTGVTVPEAGFGTRTTYSDVNLTKPASKTWAVINTTTYEITENLSVKNIFGYIDAKGLSDFATDSDGSTIFTISLDKPDHVNRNRQYTNELQFTGSFFDDRLSWTLGGLLDKTREPEGGINELNYSSVTNAGPSPTLANAVAINNRYQSNIFDSYAGFGELEYKLTDSITFTGGYRRSYDTIRALQAAATQTDYTAPKILTATGIADIQIKSKGNVYNFDLSDQITDNVMIYGGYRRGFKHGGFNSSQTNPLTANFDSEKVDDYHIGLKSDFELAGMPIRANLEGFYDIYKGMQLSYLSFDAALGALTTITTNIPKTRFVGGEADITVELTDWLEFQALYSYLDAEFTDWIDDTVPGLTGDLTDNHVPYAPKNKVFLSARFHKDLPNNFGELVINPMFSYQDKLFNGPFNKHSANAQVLAFGPFDFEAHGGTLVKAYSLVDLRIELNDIMGSQVSFALTGNNLTDKLYYTGNSGTLNFGVQGNGYAPPRQISVELSARF